MHGRVVVGVSESAANLAVVHRAGQVALQAGCRSSLCMRGFRLVVIWLRAARRAHHSTTFRAPTHGGSSRPRFRSYLQNSRPPPRLRADDRVLYWLARRGWEISWSWEPVDDDDAGRAEGPLRATVSLTRDARCSRSRNRSSPVS